MYGLEELEAILEMSVQKKGEVPLTNRHLLNIVRMAIRYGQQEADDQAISENFDIMNEHFYK